MCCIQNSFSIKRLFVLTLLFSLTLDVMYPHAKSVYPRDTWWWRKEVANMWWSGWNFCDEKLFFLFFESLKKNSKVRWEEKKMSNDVGEGMHLPKPISGFSWSYLIIQSFFLAQKHGFFFWFCDFSHTYR